MPFWNWTRFAVLAAAGSMSSMPRRKTGPPALSCGHAGAAARTAIVPVRNVRRVGMRGLYAEPFLRGSARPRQFRTRPHFGMAARVLRRVVDLHAHSLGGMPDPA